MADFADELAAMGWDDLEMLSDADLELLRMVYEPDSQVENASQIENGRQAYCLN